MEKPIMVAIEKLVFAGEQAGFPVEQMIQVLQSGASVETLLRMIEWRLDTLAAEPRSVRARVRRSFWRIPLNRQR